MTHGFFSMAILKKHPSLIPLVVFIGAASAGSIMYLGRLAFKNPEVSWNKRGDQEPWNDYKNKQYKFYSNSIDYSSLENKAPKF